MGWTQPPHDFHLLFDFFLTFFFFLIKVRIKKLASFFLYKKALRITRVNKREGDVRSLLRSSAAPPQHRSCRASVTDERPPPPTTKVLPFIFLSLSLAEKSDCWISSSWTPRNNPCVGTRRSASVSPVFSPSAPSDHGELPGLPGGWAPNIWRPTPVWTNPKWRGLYVKQATTWVRACSICVRVMACVRAFFASFASSVSSIFLPIGELKKVSDFIVSSWRSVCVGISVVRPHYRHNMQKKKNLSMENVRLEIITWNL